MKKLITISLLFFTVVSFGQHRLTGAVHNINNEPLTGATVVLLESTDSTMVNFCLTNEDGQFALIDVEEGDYLLQISFISHNTQVEDLNLNWTERDVDLGNTILEESTEILQEIEVKAEHIPMGIRGDTISYNASAFKVKPNATVEDLLKKLPGIEVDRSGNIKAQGEDVEKVLVDGKEFFGNDPKMATKNLQAEAIDKVEVYDKQSEIAEFTGIDDGEEQKTIDLKLKEDHKKGGFGNATLHTGTEDVYDGKLNYFRFSPTVQASFIAASNNINEETFTMNDRIAFMGGIGAMMSSGSFDMTGQMPMQNGINRSTSLGTNLNIDFSPKVKLNSHYIYNQVKNDLSSTSINQNLTDSFLYNNKRNEESIKSNSTQGLNTKLRYKLDPFTEFVFQNNFTISNQLSNLLTSSNYFRNSIDLGDTNSKTNSENDELGFDTKTTLKRKFQKKGRNIIGTVTFKRTNNDIIDDIDNMNNVANQNFHIVQNQIFNSLLNQLTLGAIYTEPLSKRLFLSFNYNYATSDESPFRDYFDIVGNTKQLNEELSSVYQKVYNYHVAGISLRNNAKRIKTKIGLQSQWTTLEGIINNGESSINGSFFNILPSLKVDVELKGNRSFGLDYTTSIIAPQLDQLLPLPNNTSPSFAFIGNPNLIPQYDHNFRMNYHLFDNFNLSSLFTSVGLTKSIDRIVYKSEIADDLFRTVTPINTDKFWSANGYFSFSRPLRALKINYVIKSNFSYSSYESFINNISSPVRDNNLGLSLSVRNRKTDHVFLEAGVTWNRDNKEYIINEAFNQSYFNTDYFAEIEMYIKGLTISTGFHYNRYSAEGFSENPEFILWNASISQLLFQNKLEIKLTAFDLLNQNIGYSRQGTATSISEQRYNNLGQFFMLGATYKIGNKTKKDGIIIEQY